MSKPVIGISANYTSDDQVGIHADLGFKKQEWQLLADDYINAVSSAGGLPIILPVVKRAEDIRALLNTCDGILLAGGNDIDPQYYRETPRHGLGWLEPKRDTFDISLARIALEQFNWPILGICRGCQVLNVSTGGTLYQDLDRELGSPVKYAVTSSPKYHPTHIAYIESESRLHGIFETDSFAINSFNHQAINELGHGFSVAMTTTGGVIEGIEGQNDRFVVGVQWHPEMMLEQNRRVLPLFESFVKACAALKGE